MNFKDLKFLANKAFYKLQQMTSVSGYPYSSGGDFVERFLNRFGKPLSDYIRMDGSMSKYFNPYKSLGAISKEKKVAGGDCGDCSNIILLYLLHESKRRPDGQQLHAAKIFLTDYSEGGYTPGGIHQFVVMTIDPMGINEDFYINPYNFESTQTVLVDVLNDKCRTYAHYYCEKPQLGGIDPKYYFLGSEWRSMQVFDGQGMSSHVPENSTWKCITTLQELREYYIYNPPS